MSRKGSSRSQLQYVYFKVQDFLSSQNVAKMNAAQVGGYFLLLLYCWDSEGCSLPDDDQWLMKLSRLTRKNYSFVRQMFTSHPNLEKRITNLRLLREYDRVLGNLQMRQGIAERARAKSMSSAHDGGLSKGLSIGLSKGLSIGLSTGLTKGLSKGVEGEGEGEREGEGEGEKDNAIPNNEILDRERSMTEKSTGRHDAKHRAKKHVKKHVSEPDLADPQGVVPPDNSPDIWQTYAEAYHRRYHVLPVRNARVNSILAQVIKRLGKAVAPQVAAFYLSHNGQFYVSRMHSVDFLLRDAEKLHAEWQTGKKMTTKEAQQAEALDAMHSQVDRVAKKLTELMGYEYDPHGEGGPERAETGQGDTITPQDEPMEGEEGKRGS